MHQFDSIIINAAKPIAYQFREFLVDPAALQVLCNDEPVSLPPKAVEVLVVLLENAGQTVSRSILLNTVWPDTVVEDANLSQYIYLLRKALHGEAGRSSIVTVARRGYRFTEQVQRVGDGAGKASTPNAPAARTSKQPVVSIMAFETLDKSSRSKRLGIGIAQSIAQRLVRLRGVSVRPVGDRKHATLVLSGSVLALDGRVRVAAELTDTHDGSLRWAETVDETGDDWFRIQDTLADRLVLKLAPELSNEYALQASSARQSALNLYLKGRFYWHKRADASFRKAIQHYNKALAIDPDFALAYAGLADCYNVYAYYCQVPPRSVGMKAVQAARRAVELDPNLAEGCVSLARALAENEWDWENAEALFRRALTLNPHYATAYGWYACLLVAKGRFTEGMVQMMRANELNPNSLTQNRGLGFFLYMSGRAKEAVTHLEDTLEMDSSSLVTGVYLAAACEEAGLYERAQNELARMLVEHPGNSRLLCELGCVLARSGKLEEARKIAAQVLKSAGQCYVCPYDLAMLHTALGHLDDAFHWLTTCLEVRPWRLIYAQVDPRMADLRKDNRFDMVAKRLRLEPVELSSDETVEGMMAAGHA